MLNITRCRLEIYSQVRLLILWPKVSNVRNDIITPGLTIYPDLVWVSNAMFVRLSQLSVLAQVLSADLTTRSSRQPTLTPGGGINWQNDKVKLMNSSQLVHKPQFTVKLLVAYGGKFHFLFSLGAFNYRVSCWGLPYLLHVLNFILEIKKLTRLCLF